ncbi:MAG: hypothetical protein IPQ07_27815 [Myxococcales bacterium]|nr:hypothetical protein [Myxococcales bacterium]
MTGKRRLSVSVDAELLAAAEAAVERGEAPTLSAYVSVGLRNQLENDQRLRAGREFIREYEAAHGEITEEEINRAMRSLQSRAIHVRPSSPASKTGASRASESRSRR